MAARACRGDLDSGAGNAVLTTVAQIIGASSGGNGNEGESKNVTRLYGYAHQLGTRNRTYRCVDLGNAPSLQPKNSGQGGRRNAAAERDFRPHRTCSREARIASPKSSCEALSCGLRLVLDPNSLSSARPSLLTNEAHGEGIHRGVATRAALHCDALAAGASYVEWPEEKVPPSPADFLRGPYNSLSPRAAISHDSLSLLSARINW